MGKINKEIKLKMPFDYWLNKPENEDLRMPINNKLSFINKLSVAEWTELISYIFKKCQESQEMWKD